MVVKSKRKMQYVRLGKSGLKVSRIILGCLTYGSSEWQEWLLDEKTGIEHIKAAYDLGIQTFDTANCYSNGLSEVILGKAIKEHNLPRDEIVVMTKVHFAVHKTYAEQLPDGVTEDEAGYVNQYGLSRKHIFDSVKHSLERLQLDYIDLLQCHRFDYNTPIEETMQALHDVVKVGWVRYVGISSCKAYQFHIMQNYAINNKLTPFISNQNHYHLCYREEEREMMPTLKHFGAGCIPWGPLGIGFLTRPLSETTLRNEKDDMVRSYDTKANHEILKRLEEVAKKHQASMAQIAIAWLLSKDGVTAPIVGTTKLKHIEELAAAIHIKLPEEDCKYLEELYMPMR